MKRVTAATSIHCCSNSSFFCFFQRNQKRQRIIKILIVILVAITATIPLIILSITQQEESQQVQDSDKLNQLHPPSPLSHFARGGGGGQVQKSSSSSSAAAQALNSDEPTALSTSHHHGKGQDTNVDHHLSTAASALFVPLLQRNITPPLPVVLYPFVIMGSMGKQDATVALDGLLESPLVVLVSNITANDDDIFPNLVWVADQGAARAPLPIWCRNFVQVIKDVQSQRQQQQRQGAESLLPLSWPIHIVQVSDDSTTFSQCKAAEKLLQPGHMLFFKRSLVVQRFWNETIQWVNNGHYIQNKATESGMLRHLGMPVRTDLVQALEAHLLLLAASTTSTNSSSSMMHAANSNINNNMTLAYAIEELERKTDVAHFWPLQDHRLEEVNREDGRLRDAVSHAIADLQNVTITDKSSSNNSKRALRLFVDTVGAGREEGRNTVQVDYLRQLLDTKIVVVAQRDAWEDHYRLLEGIVAGACVFTDVMLTLPRGLKNGTSIVEYSSARNLQNLILYYLEHDEERISIAKAGRDVAMRRHRSWHRMEEVLFGKPMSVCQPNQDIKVCNPWVVHAKDMYPSLQKVKK